MIEDDIADAVFVEEILAKLDGLPLLLERADCLKAGLAAIESKKPAAVLLDLGLPESVGLPTLKSLLEKSPDIPVVVMTGLDDSESAVAAMREGAQDYLVKGQFDGQILLRAVRYAIERQKLRSDLWDALDEVKRLSGFLPICSSCKKIRDDKGYWQRLELYIESHSEAKFSHSICQDCTEKLYPELFEDNPVSKSTP